MDIPPKCATTPMNPNGDRRGFAQRNPLAVMCGNAGLTLSPARARFKRSLILSGLLAIFALTLATATARAASLTIAGNSQPAASICAGSSGVLIHSFIVSGTGGGGSVTDVSFVTTGTYAAAEISNFKLYFTSSSTFSTGTLLATISSPTAAGTQ